MTTGLGPAEVAVRVVDALRERGQTLATCESLTGGLLGAVITGVPGASVVYRGGLISYATDLKETLAGVDRAVLDEHGAVAAVTAAAMARGARERCAADWGLATTGVAGPDPQEGHQAGTVFVAVSGNHDQQAVEQLSLVGDRAAIRAQTVDVVLRRLLSLLS